MFDQALRTIAALQPADIGADLVGLLDRPTTGATVAARQLAHWRDMYAWVAGDRSHPTIDAALEYLEANGPADGRVTLSWGDSRFGNLMFGPDQQVTAVLDWEMATLGRPEVDLGFFLFCARMYDDGMGLPRLGGFPLRDDAIARYAGLVDDDLDDLLWYEAYAGLQAAIMIMRIGLMLIELGVLPADSTMPVANPASVALALTLGLPVPTGESSNAEIFAGRSE